MEIHKASKVMKALSNENRLKLFLQICEAEQASFKDEGICGCFIQAISDKFRIGAPTISHHLKELVNAELIFTEKVGKQVVARVNKEILSDVRKILSH